MRSQDLTTDRLLSVVPDRPQWVELGAMLLSGQCEIYGLEDTERLSFVVRRRGLAPVWGALESNIPSMRLADKLGFTPVDELVVFEQPDYI